MALWAARPTIHAYHRRHVYTNALALSLLYVPAPAVCPSRLIAFSTAPWSCRGVNAV